MTGVPVLDLLFLSLAAVAAGFVNALAGGGTLIVFPALIAAGLPPIVANVSSTLALSPGYLSATLAQRRDLEGQGRRLALLLPIATAGGAGGAQLLLHGSDATFNTVVPWLILLSCALIGVQNPLRAWITGRRHAAGLGRSTSIPLLVLPLAAGAVYGGYFGAASSVVLLAVLGLSLDDSLTRLNALKQALSFVVSVAAAGTYALTVPLDWTPIAVMAIGALAGGMLGGRLAGRVSPAVLRVVVVTLGIVIAVLYMWRYR